eukprot:NODE_3068_length_1285_cov_77.132530_g2913_i0.p1 GENE.NODE_3068_length_1285_cov_77.132530_g2913_i0~~NODE_3068_length_1285_cov_77.132530_g2913_i0.p1  ORF type:complete len:383 (-),score=116.66 NODE_3068_length_1285_cov_77.132530_g2913_i0:136-1212(-)
MSDAATPTTEPVPAAEGAQQPAAEQPTGAQPAGTQPVAAQAAPAGPPSKKVFIGGLSPMSTRDSLTTYFSQFGQVVDVAVLMDPITGMPRGFGFVTFANDEIAAAAIANRKQTIDGKEVEVKFSENREPGAVAPAEAKKLFVGGLPPTASKDNIQAWFKQFGPVIEVILPMDNMTGMPRGYGFVTFDSEDEAQAALRHSEHTIEGKTVDVKPSQAKRADAAAGMMMGAGADSAKIFVGGLRQETTEYEIKEWFTQFGNVSEVTIVSDQTTGNSRGFGFVKFDDGSAAQAALMFQGHTIAGKAVDVKTSTKRGQNPMAAAQQQWAAMWGAYLGYPAPGAMYAGATAAWGQWGAAAAAPY